MLEFILIVVMIILYKLPSWRYHYYMPPEGQTIDYRAMSRDRNLNNLSNEEVMRNTVKGKYNVWK